MNSDYVRYIDRTRDYYLAEGYKTPYRWAHFDTIPFARLRKPLSQCRVGLVTTSDIAVRSQSGEREQFDRESLVGNVYSIPSDLPLERLYSRNEHYDQVATNLDDVNSYCPVTRLAEFAAEGRIGSVASSFHGVYTSYSQRKTIEVDAPEVLRRCAADGVDVVLLTPIWPVCHQTVSLVARHLEENGIPTIVLGCARDIVEYTGVARFLFTNFPLGNPCGKPFDVTMQREIIEMAFAMLETVEKPGTTIQSPYVWGEDESWKRKIFTKEQPFLTGEAYEHWMEAKEKYRRMKQEQKA